MTALKLLFRRYLSHKWTLLGVSVFFILMMAVVMLFHEDAGGDAADYIICKVSALVAMMMAVFLPTIFMVQDTVGNRFMRSVPCAKSLYMHGIPIFSTFVPLGWSVLTDAVYATFILITGRDISNVSDILMLTGIFGGIFALVSCIVMCMRLGAAFVVLFYLPFIIVVTTFGSSTGDYGFGLPLWAAALICCGSFLAAFTAGTVIACLTYTKGNFKEIAHPQASI